MSITTALATYFVVWWIILFAVLPFGVRSQAEEGEVSPGTDPGAPAIPHLWAKLLWTTIVSAVVFGVAAYLFVNRIITLDMLSVF